MALRSHHVDQGSSTQAFDDPRIKRILRGSLRIQGSKPIQERSEITKEVLSSIVPTFKNDHDDINIRAMFCVAFAAFLHPSEFTWENWDATSPIIHVTWQSVQFTSDGVLLHLPKSKTDQFGKGDTIPISPSGDSTCPGSALRTLFQ